ncbi:MAG: chemotaxis protein CheA [Leptospiraceae bacterium]|nr:chemotaxis protein CheA [Leptospiraceae bacterium]
MDLNEIQKAFVIEIRDLLDRVEDSLFQLEQNTTPAELDALFRALHTIKGNSGIFQAKRLESFAHTVESLLDKYRNDPSCFSPSDVPLLLSCRDHIESLSSAELAEGATGQIPEAVESQDQELKARINERLEELSAAPAATSESSDSEAVSAAEESVDGLNHLPERYHISFRPPADAMKAGLEPLNFIRFLKNLGTIECVFTLTDGMPGGESFQPQDSYIGYEILLHSRESREAVEDAFEFIKENGILRIHSSASSLTDYVETISALPESRPRLIAVWREMPFPSQDWLDRLEGKIPLMPASQTTVAQPETSLPAQVQSTSPTTSGASGSRKSPSSSAENREGVSNAEHSSVAHTSLRVDASRLDALINLVGELVIQSQSLKQISRAAKDASLEASTDTIERLIEDLRQQSMSLRMVEIGTVFQKMRRVVHDASLNLKKKIQLQLQGEDTELDRSVIERIQDPMIHLVRNSIDHGLETPEERVAAGKGETGTIELRAYQDMGHVVVEIADDGRGVDLEAVKRRAVEKGIMTEDQEVDPNQLHEWIFHPGFSTKDTVNEYSGRGVGLDVVKQGIESLGGSVQLKSEAGQGTTITLKLPLTLAIIDGFLIRAAGVHFVVPLDMVYECTELSAHKRTGNAGNFINLRGDVVPCVNLPEAFQMESEHANDLIVLQQGEHRVGLVVDELLGEYQTVVRKGGRVLGNLPGVSGVTILGTGQIAYILDVGAFFGQKAATPGVQAPGAVAASAH